MFRFALTSNPTESEQSIIDFMVLQLGRAKPGQLSVDVKLLETGVLDSLTLMSVVAFLESTYEVRFDESLIVPDNFQDVRTIAKLVDRLREG